MGGVTDETMTNIAAGIPRHCCNLRIELHDAENLTDAAFWVLWDRLSGLPTLQHLDIKLGNLSPSHTDAMMTDYNNGLAQKICLMSNLRVLVLDIERDTFQHTCLSALQCCCGKFGGWRGKPVSVRQWMQAGNN